SLRPLYFRGRNYLQNFGRTAPRAAKLRLLCFDIESGSAQIGPGPGARWTETNMTLPASALPVELPPAFLGVSQSATGKLWRDRLDPRGTARALAIAQRYQLPEMLARVLAGRDVEIDAVEDFLDPTIRKLMPDPFTVTQMEAAAKRIADAAIRGEQGAIFGDYDVDGATS